MKFISKEVVKNATKIGLDFIKKNSPHILTGTAVVGVGMTSFFAVKGALKAKDILEEEKYRRKEKLYIDYEKSNLSPETDNNPPEELVRQTTELSKKEVFKLVWKPILPAVITGATTIACIIGADVINAGRVAALMSACAISEKALEEYQKKNIELFGDKNHDKILNEKAKDDVAKHDIPDDDCMIKTGKGDMIILDALNGRYFKGSRDAVDKMVNNLNYDMYERSAISDGFISQNDFFDSIDVFERTQEGDHKGWNKRYPILIDWRSALKDDEIPVLVMYFKNPPLAEYQL